MQNEQRYTDRDADVGYIKNAGSEGADVKIHEINHTTIVHDATHEIVQFPAQHETPDNRCELAISVLPP